VRLPCRDKKGGIRHQQLAETPSKNHGRENRGPGKCLNTNAELTLIVQGIPAEPCASAISFKLETVTFC